MIWSNILFHFIVWKLIYYKIIGSNIILFDFFTFSSKNKEFHLKVQYYILVLLLDPRFVANFHLKLCLLGLVWSLEPQAGNNHLFPFQLLWGGRRLQSKMFDEHRRHSWNWIFIFTQVFYPILIYQSIWSFANFFLLLSKYGAKKIKDYGNKHLLTNFWTQFFLKWALLCN